MFDCAEGATPWSPDWHSITGGSSKVIKRKIGSESLSFPATATGCVCGLVSEDEEDSNCLWRYVAIASPMLLLCNWQAGSSPARVVVVGVKDADGG